MCYVRFGCRCGRGNDQIRAAHSRDVQNPDIFAADQNFTAWTE